MKVFGTDFVLHEVSDLGRAVAFYRDTLGLTLTFEGSEASAGWVEFEAASTTLALYCPAPEQRRPIPPGGGVTVFLAVDDVEKTLAELKTKGIEPTFGPLETGVCVMACISDPDGNPVGLHRRHDGTHG